MKKAFTLIELIATIVILGVVTSIVSILIMNIIRNAKNSANKRSIDNYGRIIETSMAEYQSQYLKYPDSIDQLEIEYVGSVIECEIRRINPDKTIYLSECKVNGKKVLDKSTEDGYYHYGILVLTNEEYVDKLGNNIELALKDYYEENNKYPINYRLLNLPKLDKDVNCVSHINPDGTVYLTKCSIDGSYILNENEEDGYYHYGEKNIYDYVDSDGNGYFGVEYLESTGEQYIDTEYVFKNKPKVTGEIMLTSSNDRDIMGNTSANAGCFIIDFVQGSQLDYRYSSVSYTSFASGTQVNKWYNFEFSDKFIVDGVEKGTIASYDFSSNTQSFLIGRGRNFGSARFKEIKMYDEDELVRDLVPCYRKRDNKPGMFDIVNKKFYTSKTSSDFDYDTPINGDTELKYIETTGEQYIDTNYVFKNKPKVTGDIMITSGADRDIMGNTTAKAGCFIIDFSSHILYYRYSSASYTSINTGIQVNKWYNFEFSDKVIADGVEKGTIDSYDFSSNTQSFLIGRGRNFGSARFKEIKMYDGDELVRDLVPYYKKDINKVGMLDKVHNIFYENQGTGELLWR